MVYNIMWQLQSEYCVLTINSSRNYKSSTFLLENLAESLAYVYYIMW